MNKYQPAGIVQLGATMFYEIIDGIQDGPVFGDEYILTHANSGRQFMVEGDISAAMTICSEVIRLDQQRAIAAESTVGA